MQTLRLNYTLRQLDLHDAIVFKSVLRVLQGKTLHDWQHTDAADADLVVLGFRADENPLASPVPGQAVIWLARNIRNAARNTLTLPLKTADVVAVLDSAGKVIAARLALATARSKAAESFPETGAQQADHATALVDVPLSTQRMVLLRWPDNALLQGDVRYCKLAAALTGRPATLAELANRVQLPAAFCLAFVQTLQAASLLHLMADVPVAAAPSLQAAPKPQGLLGRIRARLEAMVGSAPA